jgi:hypothetical protein
MQAHASSKVTMQQMAAEHAAQDGLPGGSDQAVPNQEAESEDRSPPVQGKFSFVNYGVMEKPKPAPRKPQPKQVKDQLPSIMGLRHRLEAVAEQRHHKQHYGAKTTRTQGRGAGQNNTSRNNAAAVAASLRR